MNVKEHYVPIDIGFTVVRSHNDLVYIEPSVRSAGTLKLYIQLALLKINAGCQQRTVKDLTDEKIEEICTIPEGVYSDAGKLHAKHVTEIIDSDGSITKFVTDTALAGADNLAGTIVSRKIKLGQVSRLAIAWWTLPPNDNGEIQKAVRIFGDRIKMTWAHPIVPPLFSFGLSPYSVVYPDSDSPDHCNKCKKSLRNSESFHVENPPRFLCGDCKYLHDTGFRQPGSQKRNRKK